MEHKKETPYPLKSGGNEWQFGGRTPASRKAISKVCVTDS